MKKLFVISMLGVLGFSACSKEESVLPVKNESKNEIESNTFILDQRTPPQYPDIKKCIIKESDIIRCGTPTPEEIDITKFPKTTPPIVILTDPVER